MRTLFRLVAALALLLVVVVAGGYLWASRAAAATLARSIDTHTVDFPLPAPPEGAMLAVEDSAAEVGDSIGEGEETAVERGAHLVRARYPCADCHGQDLGGGVMMDAMPMAQAFGPNLTTGEGSATLDYTAADWDRAVRHGVGMDGRPLAMPAVEFRAMSDQELADIVAYIRSLSPVDNSVAPFRTGPIGKMLIATGVFAFSADVLPHFDEHAALPPEAGVTVEFGAHLAATCAGCHNTEYSGGSFAGEPGWPPAANLTPAGALADWSLDDFVRTMREGVRPDGSEVAEPMTYILGLGQAMSDMELEAIYLFLRSLPATETPD